jgi:vancomycin permeability regulator SanA
VPSRHRVLFGLRRVAWARWRRRALLLLAAGTMLGVAGTVGSAIWIRTGADGRIFTVGDVPAAPVALVLGAQVDAGGQPSAFLAARLEIARQLFTMGKVRAVLVSGDHMDWDYDEPGAMSRWLVDRGVPPQKVVLDHAGFDTYDSCARAKRIFGVDRAIVVTQSFHLARAVTLCRRLGVDANGVGDETAQRYQTLWRRGEIREYGAAVKAAWDVLSGRDPVHLGRRETGVDDALRG